MHEYLAVVNSYPKGHLLPNEVLPNVTTKLDHDLWLVLSDQICDNLPFGLSNVHHIFLFSAIFVNCLDHMFGRASDLLYGRVAIYEMQQVYLPTVVKLDEETQTKSTSTPGVHLQRRFPPLLVPGTPCCCRSH